MAAKILAVKNLKKDHDLASLFPMGDADVESVAQSMRERGYDPAEPIVVWDGPGVVVDGYTRWEAAVRAGLDKVHVEQRDFEDKRAALEYAIHRQRDRRNLTREQLSAFIVRAIAALDRVKPRGAEVLERDEEGQLLASRDANSGKSSAVTAALVGTSQATVERARAVLNSDDETLKQAALDGKVSVNTAYGQVQEQKRKQEQVAKEIQAEVAAPTETLILSAQVAIDQSDGLRIQPSYTVAEWSALAVEERAMVIEFAPMAEAGRSAGFNEVNENIEWARWSWNPVTGCEHTCPYCYARDIANRFYPEKFVPVFRPERLHAATNKKLPKVAETEIGWRNVFVCSMADLFGKWVPTDWIEAVLDEVRRNPQWNFLFLTKFPIRLPDFDFPDNAWVGTTVDCQARVASAEQSFRRVRARVKWLSVEPMLEPLHFSDIGAFQWVVIGGASDTVHTPEWKPPRDWSDDLRRAAEEAGCMVYEKTNLLDRIRDYPGQARKDERKVLPSELHYLPSISS